MNPEFQDCLKRKKIQEFSRGGALIEKELKTARQDFVCAEESFVAKNFKWATIQSCYAMFHCARALLFAENFREKSHHCLIVAIRALYVDKMLFPTSLIESLQKAKILRENADYYDDWSQEAAGALLKSAEQFLEISRKLLLEKK
jgi:uncharacterized protein (UPF0332 family)